MGQFIVPILAQLLPSLVQGAGAVLFPEGSPDWMKWVNMVLNIFANGQDVPDKLKALDNRIADMVAQNRRPSDAEYDTWLETDVGQSDEIQANARARGLIS